jgi:hypothetical protein
MDDVYEVVSVEDPALDRSKMDVEKYAETRDPALLVLLPGAIPIRWKLRDMFESESDKCDDVGLSSPATKFNFALQFGLRSVHDGREAHVPTLTVQDLDNGGTKTIWSTEERAALRRKYGKGMVREIAWLILQRDSRQGEAFGDGSVSFTLLQSSRDALAAIGRRPAV